MDGTQSVAGVFAMSVLSAGRALRALLGTSVLCPLSSVSTVQYSTVQYSTVQYSNSTAQTPTQMNHQLKLSVEL